MLLISTDTTQLVPPTAQPCDSRASILTSIPTYKDSVLKQKTNKDNLQAFYVKKLQVSAQDSTYAISNVYLYHGSSNYFSFIWGSNHSMIACWHMEIPCCLCGIGQDTHATKTTWWFCRAYLCQGISCPIVLCSCPYIKINIMLKKTRISCSKIYLTLHPIYTHSNPKSLWLLCPMRNMMRNQLKGK